MGIDRTKKAHHRVLLKVEDRLGKYLKNLLMQRDRQKRDEGLRQREWLKPRWSLCQFHLTFDWLDLSSAHFHKWYSSFIFRRLLYFSLPFPAGLCSGSNPHSAKERTVYYYRITSRKCTAIMYKYTESPVRYILNSWTTTTRSCEEMYTLFCYRWILVEEMTAAHVVFWIVACSRSLIYLVLCIWLMSASLCLCVEGARKMGFSEFEIYSQIVHMKVVRERGQEWESETEKYKTAAS